MLPVPLRIALVTSLLLPLAARPAAALGQGSVELSYSTPARGDFVSVAGGGPPEEGNPPLPIDVSLTTPVPDTPGVDDAFVGVRGAVEAEVGGLGGPYLQSVGAAVGGVEFANPFGGTDEDLILWSDDPVGDGPFQVSARATVSQEVRYQLLAQELWVDFEWSGVSLFFANGLPADAEYEYGWSITASIFSTVEDGFYATFPEIGALGGPGLTVTAGETLAPFDESFVFDFATLGIPFFGPADVGNFFRVRLDLEVWIEGESFVVEEFALIQNVVDFTSTLGVTSVAGGVIAAPEPGAPWLALAGLSGLWLASRHRRQ